MPFTSCCFFVAERMQKWQSTGPWHLVIEFLEIGGGGHKEGSESVVLLMFLEDLILAKNSQFELV